MVQCPFDDGLRAEKVAAWPPAYLDGVRARGRESKVLVEGCYSPHLVDARLGEGRNLLDGFLRNVAECILSREQGGKDSNGRALLMRNGVSHALPQIFVGDGQGIKPQSVVTFTPIIAQLPQRNNAMHVRGSVYFLRTWRTRVTVNPKG